MKIRKLNQHGTRVAFVFRQICTLTGAMSGMWVEWTLNCVPPGLRCGGRNATVDNVLPKTHWLFQGECRTPRNRKMEIFYRVGGKRRKYSASWYTARARFTGSQRKNPKPCFFLFSMPASVVSLTHPDWISPHTNRWLDLSSSTQYVQIFYFPFQIKGSGADYGLLSYDNAP